MSVISAALPLVGSRETSECFAVVLNGFRIRDDAVYGPQDAGQHHCPVMYGVCCSHRSVSMRRFTTPGALGFALAPLAVSAAKTPDFPKKIEGEKIENLETALAER
jgi:hypothetical protein